MPVPPFNAWSDARVPEHPKECLSGGRVILEGDKHLGLVVAVQAILRTQGLAQNTSTEGSDTLPR